MKRIMLNNIVLICLLPYLIVIYLSCFKLENILSKIYGEHL